MPSSTPSFPEPANAGPPKDHQVRPELHLLIVDDDPDVSLALRTFLEMEGFRVTTAGDGKQALDLMERDGTLDLVLLDVMLPEVNGFDVLRTSHERGLTTPVLMMSGRGSQEDILRGFGLGAHDYVVKPFEPDELAARVRAILGRTMAPADAPMKRFRSSGLEVNFSTHEVRLRGRVVPLSEVEFDLLRCLIQNHGTVVTRKRLLEEAWHMDVDSIAFSIDMDVVGSTLEKYVASLREKIEPDPLKPRLLETVYGQGYRFNAE